jgi:hypothetical protein
MLCQGGGLEEVDSQGKAQEGGGQLEHPQENSQKVGQTTPGHCEDWLGVNW